MRSKHHRYGLHPLPDQPAHSPKLRDQDKNHDPPHKIRASRQIIDGGTPASLLTEPIRLEMGYHWELIHLIVVPKITDAMILGLAWLDKWTPTIWWEGRD